MKEENKIIELIDVCKEFDGVSVVENMNFYVRKGEFVTFLGPSGCGKTTTLRMIAGFELPTSGKILLNGEDISNLPPNRRPVNTVFQKYALFPHLNVFENVAFGLKLKRIETEYTDKKGNTKIKKEKLPATVIAEKVKKALEIVDLVGFEKRNISTLSGGQQQRIAIARAIVNEPEILLLDEPLGALDLKMRKDMQLELKEMHKKLGITFIYVTSFFNSSGSISHTMAEAPFSIALLMKACPSVCVPLTATNKCPDSIWRESMWIPEISWLIQPMVSMTFMLFNMFSSFMFFPFL